MPLEKESSWEILTAGPCCPRSLPDWSVCINRSPQHHAELPTCPTGRALDLDIHLEGAPNWRAPNEDSLNVYGCAQPTLSGLRSILALLGCRISPGQEQGAVDGGGEQNRCVWFCTREEPISVCLRSSRPAAAELSSAQSTSAESRLSSGTVRLPRRPWRSPIVQRTWKALKADSRRTFCASRKSG